MHRLNTAGSMFVVALLMIFFVTELQAQFPGGGSGGRGSRGAPGEAGRGAIQTPRPTSAGDIVELIEFRLGMLEEDLRLTPGQTRDWDTYARRVHAAAEDLVRTRPTAQSIALPTAQQQINHAVDSARNRLTALEDVAAASKVFYDTLGNEQKMLFDSRANSIVSVIAGGTAQTPAP